MGVQNENFEGRHWRRPAGGAEEGAGWGRNHRLQLRAAWGLASPLGRALPGAPRPLIG